MGVRASSPAITTITCDVWRSEHYAKNQMPQINFRFAQKAPVLGSRLGIRAFHNRSRAL